MADCVSKGELSYVFVDFNLSVNILHFKIKKNVSCIPFKLNTYIHINNIIPIRSFLVAFDLGGKVNGFPLNFKKPINDNSDTLTRPCS